MPYQITAQVDFDLTQSAMLREVDHALTAAWLALRTKEGRESDDPLMVALDEARGAIKKAERIAGEEERAKKKVQQAAERRAFREAKSQTTT